MNLAVPYVDVGLELLGVLRPDGAVDAVGGDDQVRVAEPEAREVGIVLHLGLEAQLDAELDAPGAGGCRRSCRGRCR